MHDRRHHFVTLLAEQGVPPETAMAIVGHMNSAMLRHYTHIRDGVKRQAVKHIDAANAVGIDELRLGLAAAKRSKAKKKKLSQISAGETKSQALEPQLT